LEIPFVAVMEAACQCLVLIVVGILIPAGTATPPAVEATPTHAARTEATPTKPEVMREARRSSRTRPACRLLATDPYLSSRVRQMAADGKTHLIKYSLLFPDGSSHNLTGTDRTFSPFCPFQ